MRAFKNQCLLLVAVLVLLPSQADGQISRFFNRSTTNTRQTHIPSANGAVVASPRRETPQVRQVQLEELIPDPIVPSPLNEATIPGLDAAPAMDFSGPTNAPAMAESIAPPAAVKNCGEVYGGGSYGEVYASPQPIVEAPLEGHIVDSGIGQAYDIPLNSVIPQQSAETYSTGDWFRNGNWYSRQEFSMLLRADLPHQHIALDQTVGGFTVNGFQPFGDPNISHSMSTKNLDFTYEAGTRLTIGHRLGRDPGNRDHSLELTFFGLFDYSNGSSMARTNPNRNFGIFSLLGSEESVFSSLTGAVGFATLNPIAGLNANNTVDVLYRSNFNSFELNYVLGARPAKDRLVMQPDGRWVRHATPSKVRGIFAGLRYIKQNELFEYQGSGEVQNDGTIESDVGGHYRVKTDNDLVGLQIGGELVRKRTDWVVGFKGKIGGLVNFADRSNRLSQTTASTPDQVRVVTTAVTSGSDTDETLAFMGEGGMYIAYYVRPNTALRFGYDVLYLNGMATATNNLGIRGSEFVPFEMTGDSLYHGMNFGFEMTW